MPVSALENSPAQPPLERPERRDSHRVHTVFFVARVTRESDVGLFRVRNISDSGMMLVAHVPFQPRERVRIELSENLAVEGTVEWQDEERCGIRFDEPIDCAAFLHSLAEEKRECRRNTRRLPLTRLATSYSECGLRAVKITDLSPRGVGLTHDGTLRAGTHVTLVLETGLTREGAVCWSEEGRAGVYLAEPFNHHELESASSL